MRQDLDHVRVPRPEPVSGGGQGGPQRPAAHADLGELPKAKAPELQQGRIIVITGNFDEYDSHGIRTGRQQFTASHGIDEETGEHVVLPWEHPRNLGATYDPEIREWVLPASGGSR